MTDNFIKQQNATATLIGVLNFNTASHFLNQSKVLFANAQKKTLSFDFSELAFVQNSVALALIIEWLKLAKRYQVTLELQNLSPSLLSLAKVSGVSSLLD